MARDWVDDEIDNWVRYSWSGPWPHPLPQTRALSAEGRYERDSAIDGAEELEEQAKRIPINHDNAKIIEDVYKNRLSSRERKVVQRHYVKHMKRDKAAYELGLGRRLYAEALKSAKRQIAMALEGKGLGADVARRLSNSVLRRN